MHDAALGRSLLGITLVSSAWLMACEQVEPATEVLVVAHSDLLVGEEIDALEVRVLARDELGEDTPPTLSYRLTTPPGEGEHTLPLSFSVSPKTDRGEEAFRVVLSGLLAGEVIVEQQAIASYVARRSLQLDMFLIHGCLHRLCRDPEGARSDQACNPVSRGCEPTPISGSLPPWQGPGSELVTEFGAIEVRAANELDAGEPERDGLDAEGDPVPSPVEDDAPDATEQPSPSMDASSDAGGEDAGNVPPDSRACLTKEAVCNDLQDDDCDQKTDCEDSDCAGAASCCVATQREHELTCSGGSDEDCDGFIDCQDSDCRPTAPCCPSPSAESGSLACTDKLDNDCDGVTDCAETNCATTYACTCKPTGNESLAFSAASCLDEVDNDCDGLSDCNEKECELAANCCNRTANTETGAACSNKINDDCDSAGPDCADPDCAATPACLCPTPVVETCATHGDCPICGDAIDNDCSGYSDCREAACSGSLQCCRERLGTGLAQRETPNATCRDGINNDCDAAGQDCSDPDCAADACCTRVAENTMATCTDGADNDCNTRSDCQEESCRPFCACQPTTELCGNMADEDCDGLIDCRDPQCTGTKFCPITSTETVCNDQLDNDADRYIDCDDSDCAGIFPCRFTCVRCFETAGGLITP